MRAYFTAPGYDPEDVQTRYVRFDGTAFRFCETNAQRLDVRQGYVSEDELPAYIARKAKLRAGIFPGYVEWPFYAEADLPKIDVRARALARMLREKGAAK